MSSKSTPHDEPESARSLGLDASGSANLSVPSSSRNRSSSVGSFNVGDTLPAWTTRNRSKLDRRQSSARIEALRETAGTDSALVNNMIIAFRELSYRHTWIKPGMILLIVFGVYIFADPRSHFHSLIRAMIEVSYPIEGTDQYGKGINDFYFVGFYALLFTFTREFLMCCVLRPFAHYCGFQKEGRVRRVMEQFYSLIYYGILGPFGLWIMYNSPMWFFKTLPFYENFPHKTHDFWFKIYYLGQAAFWVQQSVVLMLGLEKPRKDFVELVLHHIVTIALIWTSYRFHFTYMGLEVFITMDVSDFFLSLSKLSNYFDSSATIPLLVIFVFVWTYLRHYINLKILWSVLTTFKTVGPYEVNWVTQQYKCYISQPIVFGLLAALQSVNAYWLFLILRIMWRYLVGNGVKDDRSDDEGEDESSEEDVKKT